MMIGNALILLALFQAGSVPAAIDGRGSPDVDVPRLGGASVVDGVLDEVQWASAARLGGFSQYRPVDGRPAEERTEVLVWYSATALNIGLIAHDTQPGTIRATVADRDNLARDDNITIYLDTFNDRRRCFFFTVNPLGAQEDGVLSEGAFNAGTLFGGTVDRNPDFKWDSKGTLTPSGYAVEVRIPFKSLRFPSDSSQRWGFNVLRKVQRTGYEDTWTDVRRASASFLGQAGTLRGLQGLERGVVMEAQPFVTANVDGERSADGSFERGGVEVNPGINLKLAYSNVSFDATVNPDFSQVESDVGQVTLNQRFALFYPEKRPFFLEGIDLFATPNQLVYTRRVQNPSVGGKFTGKVGRFGLAYLSAVDDTPSGNAVFNIARVRRDLGTNSLLGMTFTSRTAPGEDNELFATDLRYVFRKLYYLQVQAGASHTTNAEGSSNAPLWSAEYDRTGRAWGFNYKLNAIGDRFDAAAGFVPRTNIVEGHAFNRFTIYGRRGAFLENLNVFAGPSRIWDFGGFGHEAPIEGNEMVSTIVQMRGGWSVSTRITREFYRFDPDDYSGYTVTSATGASRPFVAPTATDREFVFFLTVTSPTFSSFDGKVEFGRGETPIFQEASEGNETRGTLLLNYRPTDTLRFELSQTVSHIVRVRDGSEFARTVIPRVKIEFQPRRSFFVRLVSEYRAERRAPLADPRTGELLRADVEALGAQNSNGLRFDLLASYEPTPGTVAFVGYGSSLNSSRTFSFSDLTRTSDGFFVKLAYLFRK